MFTNDIPTLEKPELLKLEVGDLIAIQSRCDNIVEVAEVVFVGASDIRLDTAFDDDWLAECSVPSTNVHFGGKSNAGYWTIIGIILAKNYD